MATHKSPRWPVPDWPRWAMRIVLAGYAGEHDDLTALGWKVEAWKANGGYGSRGTGRGRDNAAKERLWFSPHCLHAKAQIEMFG